MKSLDEEDLQIWWIELKDWKLKKNSLKCVAPLILTGIKELSNTRLWMVIATPNS